MALDPAIAFLGDHVTPWALQNEDGSVPDLSDRLELLDATVFLYPSVEAANAGVGFGGSGVIVGVPLPNRSDMIVRYAVTNWHVACQAGASVVRVNRKGGGTHNVDLDPSQWAFISGGSDLAATVLRLPSDVSVPFIPTSMFIDPTDPGGVFVGDEAFMVGRFIDYDGHETNRPALRFGFVSMLNAPIRQVTGYTGASHILDMHSRSGFSGSPVYLYRHGNVQTLGMTLGPRADGKPREKLDRSSPGHSWGGGFNTVVRLLGLQWGHFQEQWKVNAVEPSDTTAIREGAYVSGFSGMSCVVPAGDILALLNKPSLVEERLRIEAQLPPASAVPTTEGGER